MFLQTPLHGSLPVFDVLEHVSLISRASHTATRAMWNHRMYYSMIESNHIESKIRQNFNKTSVLLGSYHCLEAPKIYILVEK